MIDPGQATLVAASIVLSMALTPLIVRHNGRIAAWLLRHRHPLPAAQADLVDVSGATAALSGHVVICGYGRVGQAVGRILSREGVEFVAVDEDPVRVQEALLGGENVFYGDARRPALLHALGIARARLVVVSFTDHRHALAIVRAVRERAPELPILVRTTDDRHRDVLKQAGVTAIVPETFEASLTLASHVLALLDFPMERVQQSVQGVREERYGVLRGYFHGQRSRIEDTQGQALEVRHAVRLPDERARGRPAPGRTGSGPDRRRGARRAPRRGRGTGAGRRPAPAGRATRWSCSAPPVRWRTPSDACWAASGAAGYWPVHYDVVIIGGGAAGLMCAIVAGQRGRRVLVLEHANRVGKKILMSGGGRCNFTNLGATPENFLSQNPHFCKSALARYTPWDFVALVERHGIRYHEKEAGQLFCDESSKQIVALLLDECAAGRCRDPHQLRRVRCRAGRGRLRGADLARRR